MDMPYLAVASYQSRIQKNSQLSRHERVNTPTGSDSAKD